VWAGVLALTAAAALGILLLAPLVTGQVLTLLGGRLPRLLAPLATLRESLGRAGTARVLGAMLCLSLVSQTLIYLTYGLLLRAAGLDVPLFGALLVFSLVEAASVLPVHGLLSLGSQEAVWAAGLNLLGVDALQGAAAGLLVHSGFLLFSSLAAGAAVLPIPRRPRR
ncbi:MAG TPA: lysylphosphatidylglycerol synthase domain-containing protein, partial [Candidatus Nitrosotenuis sp.]|nr:lysylphosphatidylglycerol synthase domain-containing protein [Candidatus Nitrosotenuis sp.]